MQVSLDHLNFYFHISRSRARFFNFDTLDTFGRIILRLGAVLCFLGCSTESLVSRYNHQVQTAQSHLSEENVSRHCDMQPGVATSVQLRAPLPSLSLLGRDHQWKMSSWPFPGEQGSCTLPCVYLTFKLSVTSVCLSGLQSLRGAMDRYVGFEKQKLGYQHLFLFEFLRF